MCAETLTFPDHLQEAIDAGAITAELAWRLAWDVEVRTYDPWCPVAQGVNLRVILFHWEPVTAH